MPEPVVELSAAGGTPLMEIIVGQAQFGTYQVMLWDDTGHNPEHIGQGVNTDDVPDIFPIQDSRGNLDNRILSWNVIVAAFGGRAGQRYSVKVNITQNNQPVQGGTFSYAGPLKNTQIVSDIVRLKII